MSKKRSHRPTTSSFGGRFPTRSELEEQDELRDRLTVARRSVRREFRDHTKDHTLRDLIRTETDPFTHDKIYKKIDGTRAKVETRPILVPRSTTVKQPTQYHVQTHSYFSDPRRTVICHARKLRRRVMFALGLTRRGAGSGRRHNFTDTSRIRCSS